MGGINHALVLALPAGMACHQLAAGKQVNMAAMQACCQRAPNQMGGDRIAVAFQHDQALAIHQDTIKEAVIVRRWRQRGECPLLFHQPGGGPLAGGIARALGVDLL